MTVAKDVTQKILSNFPLQHIRYAFCYGSGAFPQTGSKMASNVLDFIFVVSDPRLFHTENLKRNSSHYSCLKYLGSRAVSSVQGRGVYFNTLVPVESRIIKYGVISQPAFLSDLTDWTSLYVSGRLQKPVQEVLSCEEEDTKLQISAAINSNLRSALYSALFLLPTTFTERELYTAITSLSYKGDFRMILGEDRNKITNIVAPNMERFRHLYQPVIEKECAAGRLVWDKNQLLLSQPTEDYKVRWYRLGCMPSEVVSLMTTRANMSHYRQMAKNENLCRYCLRHVLSRKVLFSSVQQTVKSALTAGLTKSAKYSLAKLSKMSSSMSARSQAR